MIFDIMNSKTDLEKWKNTEHTRQADKTINNRIGDFIKSYWAVLMAGLTWVQVTHFYSFIRLLQQIM
ncbi:MAG: Eco47II family restriction endonuclease [Nitrosopumilaceae archaeon]|nr:Eco47II family restriction endonuclease [Nitrosopumilaceae archaeon]